MNFKVLIKVYSVLKKNTRGKNNHITIYKKIGEKSTRKLERNNTEIKNKRVEKKKNQTTAKVGGIVVLLFFFCDGK